MTMVRIRTGRPAGSGRRLLAELASAGAIGGLAGGWIGILAAAVAVASTPALVQGLRQRVGRAMAHPGRASTVAILIALCRDDRLPRGVASLLTLVILAGAALVVEAAFCEALFVVPAALLALVMVAMHPSREPDDEPP